MNSGTNALTGTAFSRPRNDVPQPHWNSAVIAPYAAATDSRFISAAFSGATIERSSRQSSRNDAATTTAR